MKKSIKRIVSAVSTGILILCALVCLVSVTKSILGVEPSVFGFRCFYIVTGSMEPTVPVDSAIIVHKQSSYSVGDIVTFQSENAEIRGNPNTHRIVETYTAGDVVYYRTKGDANTLLDAESITGEQIYGKMIFQTGRAEWIGTFLSYMVTPSGFLTIVGIPIILITVIFMRDYLKAMRADAKQKETVPDPAAADAQEPLIDPEVNDEKEKSDEKEERP